MKETPNDALLDFVILNNVRSERVLLKVTFLVFFTENKFFYYIFKSDKMH